MSLIKHGLMPEQDTHKLQALEALTNLEQALVDVAMLPPDELNSILRECKIDTQKLIRRVVRARAEYIGAVVSVKDFTEYVKGWIAERQA